MSLFSVMSLIQKSAYTSSEQFKIKHGVRYFLQCKKSLYEELNVTC